MQIYIYLSLKRNRRREENKWDLYSNNLNWIKLVVFLPEQILSVCLRPILYELDERRLLYYGP